MYDDYSDEELMGLVYAGDDSAFTELVARYSARLLRHFLKAKVKWNDAQDLVQEVFLRVVRTKYTGRARYDASSQRPFYAWIMCIAHNVLCSYYRSCQRSLPLEYATPDVLEAAAAIEIDLPKLITARDEVGFATFLEELAKCKNLLSERHRASLELEEDRIAQGKTRKEIAQELEMKEMTLHGRVFRAQHKLIDLLKGRGYSLLACNRCLPTGTRVFATFERLDVMLIHVPPGTQET